MRSHHRRLLLRGKKRGDIRSGIGAPQVMVQGVYERDDAIDRRLRIRFITVGVGHQHSAQRARAPDKLSPQLAAFPEAVIAGVVPKSQKDCQRQPDQRERNRCQRDLDVEYAAVQRSDNDGQYDRHAQRPDDPGHHRPAHGEKETKAIGPFSDNHVRAHLPEENAGNLCAHAPLWQTGRMMRPAGLSPALA